jgi:chemotaxis signal transduction protein
VRSGARTITLEEILAAAAEPAVEEGLRAMVVFLAGGRLFAIAAEAVERVTERRFVAPLPSPPAGLLGVASIGGRMRLVVDPAADGARVEARSAFVVLHGDAQLALAADRVCAVITIPEGDPVHYDGREAEVLDPEGLLVL